LFQPTAALLIPESVLRLRTEYAQKICECVFKKSLGVDEHVTTNPSSISLFHISHYSSNVGPYFGRNGAYYFKSLFLPLRRHVQSGVFCFPRHCCKKLNSFGMLRRVD